MLRSCCLMTKGVVLLIEVSCTEICVCTSRNTCTVIFQAVSALLHRCCRNSLTACSKPGCCVWCAEMLGVHGGHCSGIFGYLSRQNCPNPFRQHTERGHGWGRPGVRQPWLGGTRCWLLISVRGWDNLISGNIWTLGMAPC